MQVRGMSIYVYICVRVQEETSSERESLYCVHAVSRLFMGRSVIIYNTCINIYIVACVCVLWACYL